MPTPKNIPDHAKPVFEGEIFTVWQWEQKLYDGSTKVFEGISRTDSAKVIGILPDKRILLVKDEQPHRKGALIDAAGGQVEEGETPEQAATREFEEETGYKPESLTPLFKSTPYGKIGFTVHMFIGKSIQKDGLVNTDAGERIEPFTVSFEEFLALGQNPDMRDTALRIMLLEAQIDAKKRQALEQALFG